MQKRTINGIYENGVIRVHGTIRLGRKLPSLRNHSRVRLSVELVTPTAVTKSFGLIRVPKRIARLVAESPDISLLNTL